MTRWHLLTEDTVRRMETAFGFDRGWLDLTVNDVSNSIPVIMDPSTDDEVDLTLTRNPANDDLVLGNTQADFQELIEQYGDISEVSIEMAEKIREAGGLTREQADKVWFFLRDHGDMRRSAILIAGQD